VCSGGWMRRAWMNTRKPMTVSAPSRRNKGDYMRSAIIFDVETRIDKSLVNTTRYPHEGLTDDQAYQRYKAELKAERGSDFLPVVFHIPISIAVALVEDYHLIGVSTLAQDIHAPLVPHTPVLEQLMVEEFWRLVNKGHMLVTFFGHGFDMPVLELAALQYGIQVPKYWSDKGYRHRYSEDRHYDVANILSNMGAVHGLRLNDLLIMLGYRGKGDDIDGSKVQQMWEDGKIEAIHSYCRRDVILTFALWLRLELIRGRLSHQKYAEVCEAADPWLKEIQ
jgi:predicted PolB exonuclease-like 3'-5' exonuclease